MMRTRKIIQRRGPSTRFSISISCLPEIRRVGFQTVYTPGGCGAPKVVHHYEPPNGEYHSRFARFVKEKQGSINQDPSESRRSLFRNKGY
jgi:hypothetical protein